MEREIDDIVRLALELIMCALVVGAVALCAIAGNTLYFNKQLKDGNNAHLSQAAELYYYNNKVVTGSNAIELMLTHTRDYRYTFNYYDASGNLIDSVEISRKYEGGNYQDYWSVESISSKLKGLEKSKFSATLDMYSGNSGIAGVIFDAIGG